MPCSCLRGRSRRIQDHDEETRNKVQKKTREKPKYLVEAIFVLPQCPRTRLDFGSCPASLQVSPRASCHSNTAPNKGYPLPLPLPLNSPDHSARSTACSSVSYVLYNYEDDSSFYSLRSVCWIGIWDSMRLHMSSFWKLYNSLVLFTLRSIV